MTTFLLAGLIWLAASVILGLIVGHFMHPPGPTAPCDCDLCRNPWDHPEYISGRFNESGIDFDRPITGTVGTCTECGNAFPLLYLREDGRCMDCHFPTFHSRFCPACGQPVEDCCCEGGGRIRGN